MKAQKNTSDKPRVVAIDDSPMLVNFLKTYLSKEYEVITYASTSQALKDLSEGKVDADCVLTDYNLQKDLTGIQFLQRVKEVDPEMPVLVLSGSVDMNQRIECLQSGAADFISKPFNPKELDVRIKNALASSPLNASRHAV